MGSTHLLCCCVSRGCGPDGEVSEDEGAARGGYTGGGGGEEAAALGGLGDICSGGGAVHGG